MAKKKAKPVVQDVEVSVVEDDVEDQQQDSTADDDGLTYEMRYTLGLFNPKKSEVGYKVYDLFFETNVLKEAKKEAEKVFKAENLTVAIWDSDGMCTPPILYEPEEVKDDDSTTTTAPPPKKRTASKRSAEKPADRPKPKHPRRNKS